MAEYRYITQEYDPNHMARVVGRDLSISSKHAIEICNHIRGKPVARAKRILEDSIAKKIPIPLKRFNWDVGHRKGNMASGRFMVNACTEILKLLNSVETNAQFKGLSTSNLVIAAICTQRGARPWHYGRQHRRRMKRSTIEILVKESAEGVKKEIKTKTAVEKPAEKKAEPKKEAKPAEKPVEKKPEVKKEDKSKVEQKKPEAKPAANQDTK